MLQAAVFLDVAGIRRPAQEVLFRCTGRLPCASGTHSPAGSISKPGVGIAHLALTAGAVLGCRVCRISRQKRLSGREGKSRRHAGEGATWHIGRSAASDPVAALREVICTWRASMQQVPLPADGVPQHSFALVFVPRRFAADLEKMSAELMEDLCWPDSAPFVTALNEGSFLLLCTQLSEGKGQTDKFAPIATFLGRAELEKISALALDPEIRRDNKLKINTTVYAAHAFMQRQPQQVGSILVFADLASGARAVQRALALLDIAYPSAAKAGLVVGREGQHPPLALGREACGQGGVMAVLLPGLLHSAISLCGCQPVGQALEVADCDLQQGGFIRTVVSAEWEAASLDSEVQKVFALPPRRQLVPAAAALRATA
ncbi:unnamed protein product, partial [Polarella glacialis]